MKALTVPHKMILILTVVVILLLYFIFGSYAEVYQYHQQQPLRQLVQKIKQDPVALGQLTRQLQQRLDERGGDAKGWYLLARLYMHQQRYREASHAFAQAYQRDPQEKALLSWQLESVYLANHEQLTDEVKALMKKVQQVDPQSVVLQQLLH